MDTYKKRETGSAVLWILFTIILVIVAVLVIFRFTQTDDTQKEVQKSSSEVSVKKRVALEVLNLRSLEKGHYELWAMLGSQLVSLGKFQAQENSKQFTTLEGDSIEDNIFTSTTDLAAASQMFITIEGSGDADGIPSNVRIIRGDVVNEQAQLNFRSVDLSVAEGQFILATPTDKDAKNETQGVWFVILGDVGSEKEDRTGLLIPDAPLGWIYESWVEVATNAGVVKLSMGRFREAGGADSFKGYSGDVAGPNFPGEDLLTNTPAGLEFPLDIASGNVTVSITLEPDIQGIDPTNGTQFYLRPFFARVEKGIKPRTPIALQLDVQSFPIGRARIMNGAPESEIQK